MVTLYSDWQSLPIDEASFWNAEPSYDEAQNWTLSVKDQDSNPNGVRSRHNRTVSSLRTGHETKHLHIDAVTNELSWRIEIV